MNKSDRKEIYKRRESKQSKNNTKTNSPSYKKSRLIKIELDSTKDLKNSQLKECTIKKEWNLNLQKELKIKITKSLLNELLYNRYNTTKNDYNDFILNCLMFNRNCHLVSLFKDYMIYDYIEEFLKRYYNYKESIDRLPKISQYYRNYLKFFCKPFFKSFYLNNIIQNYTDNKAECYYKINYGFKKDKENSKIDKELLNTIFNKTLKDKINNISYSSKSINLHFNISGNNSGLMTSRSKQTSILSGSFK